MAAKASRASNARSPPPPPREGQRRGRRGGSATAAAGSAGRRPPPKTRKQQQQQQQRRSRRRRRASSTTDAEGDQEEAYISSADESSDSAATAADEENDDGDDIRRRWHEWFKRTFAQYAYRYHQEWRRRQWERFQQQQQQQQQPKSTVTITEISDSDAEPSEPTTGPPSSSEWRQPSPPPSTKQPDPGGERSGRSVPTVGILSEATRAFDCYVGIAGTAHLRTVPEHVKAIVGEYIQFGRDVTVTAPVSVSTSSRSRRFRAAQRSFPLGLAASPLSQREQSAAVIASKASPAFADILSTNPHYDRISDDWRKVMMEFAALCVEYKAPLHGNAEWKDEHTAFLAIAGLRVAHLLHKPEIADIAKMVVVGIVEYNRVNLSMITGPDDVPETFNFVTDGPDGYFVRTATLEDDPNNYPHESDVIMHALASPLPRRRTYVNAFVGSRLKQKVDLSLMCGGKVNHIPPLATRTFQSPAIMARLNRYCSAMGIHRRYSSTGEVVVEDFYCGDEASNGGGIGVQTVMEIADTQRVDTRSIARLGVWFHDDEIRTISLVCDALAKGKPVISAAVERSLRTPRLLRQ